VQREGGEEGTGESVSQNREAHIRERQSAAAGGVEIDAGGVYQAAPIFPIPHLEMLPGFLLQTGIHNKRRPRVLLQHRPVEKVNCPPTKSTKFFFFLCQWTHFFFQVL